MGFIGFRHCSPVSGLGRVTNLSCRASGGWHMYFLCAAKKQAGLCSFNVGHVPTALVHESRNQGLLLQLHGGFRDM